MLVLANIRRSTFVQRFPVRKDANHASRVSVLALRGENGLAEGKSRFLVDTTWTR
jgi:hypothetical protein